MKEKYKLISNLVDLLSPFKPRIGWIISLSVTNALIFSIIDPIAFKYLIDSISDGDQGFFIIFGLALVGVATFGRWLAYKISLAKSKLKNDIREMICINLIESYYSYDYEKIHKHGKGYYISRINDESEELSSIVDVLESSFIAIFVFFASICLALWIDWKVTSILLVVIPSVYFISKYFGGKIKVTTRNIHESEANFKSTLSVVLDSFKFVKVFDLKYASIDRIRSAIRVPLENHYLNSKNISEYTTINAIFFSYIEIVVIIFSGIQVIAGVITLGSLFALTRAFSFVVQSVQNISSTIPEILSIFVIAERYKDFINDSKNKESKKTPQINKNILFDNFSYSYDDMKLFENLTLAINSDDRIIISGSNGSGKSTLLNLIAGIYKPSSGVIHQPDIGDISASLYPFELFPGSVLSVFRLLADKYDNNELLPSLIKALNMDSFIDHDYNFLSEGQKKRCQIAVCLLKPAKWYLFDEPLANIDSKSKKEIVNLIDSYTRSSALIMVMHEHEDFHHIFNKEIQIRNNNIFIEDL